MPSIVTRRQHGAHRRDGGAVGAVLVAPTDPAGGGERRRLGDPHQLHGQVAVGAARGRRHSPNRSGEGGRSGAAGPAATAVASRLVLDWNPNDPDTVKVHYDVSAWSLDQRAELTEALAEADIAHVWEGDEVVVPEELEADADELFARLEELLGPFAVALDDDDAGRRVRARRVAAGRPPDADPGAHRVRGAAPLGRHDGHRGHRRRGDRRRAARRHRAGHARAGRRAQAAPERPRVRWTRCSRRRTAWPATPTTRSAATSCASCCRSWRRRGRRTACRSGRGPRRSRRRARSAP